MCKCWVWFSSSSYANPAGLSKSAKIEPSSLTRSCLPGRIVDYVLALNPDAIITRAWRFLPPLPGALSKSWNHTTRLRHNPIAINIETKGPMKS